MRRLCSPALLLSWLLLPAVSFAVPGSLTYQGRIKNTDGLPLEYNGVKFEFSIINPTGTCAIYRETSIALDMRNSSGVFDVPIGTGSKAYPPSSTFKLLDSFDNSTPFTCEGGGTYTPLADDKRLLRVQFFDGIGWRLISPDNEIRTVPFAGQAKVAQTANKLGSNIASDFILKSDIPLCGVGQYLRHIAPLGTFECTALTVAGNNVTGNITGSAAGFTGSLSGDVSGAQSATSVNKIKGIAVDMTGIGPGKVLKYNGTSWAPADDEGTTGALTGLTGDVTSTGSPTATVTLNNNSVSTAKIADGAVTSAKIADGTIVDADISGSANIADTKIATITTAGKVSGSAITSGTIGGSTSINTSGTVTSAGVSTGTLGVNTLQIYKTGNGNKVTVTAPTSLSSDYSLQLPGDAGGAGQILSTNGSGVLSWVNPASGSMTSVTATAPLASTAGSTPVLSLNDSGVTPGDYIKVTVSAKGLVTAGSSLSASDIPNLAGDVTSTSGTSNTKVEKIQGVAVSSTTPLAGQVLIYGSNWAPQYFGMGQLRSTVTGSTQVPASCSTADKTLTWSAITDSFTCTSIAIANTQVTGLGTASTKNFGTAAGNLVELDGAGKIPTSLLPSSTGSILDGGNSTGATVSIGTNDSNALAFKTNSTTKMTMTPAGFLGIGTTTPDASLTVSLGQHGGTMIKTENTMNGSDANAVLRAATSAGEAFSHYGGLASTLEWVVGRSYSPYDFRIGRGSKPSAVSDFVISQSGNVGVGTTTPSATLDVNGTAKANSFNIGYEKVTNNCGAVAAGVTCSVSCPGTKKILTGGCASTGAAFDYNYPSSDNTWICRSPTSTTSMYATATCANLQ